MSDTITKIIFNDNTLVRYVTAEDLMARWDDRAYEEQRQAALNELTAHMTEGYEPSDDETVRIFAKHLGLPERIMDGKIEYEVDVELAQFLNDHRSEYKLALLAAEPAKAKKALATHGLTMDDVFSPYTVRMNKMADYFDDSALVVDSVDDTDMQGVGNKYRVRYSGVQDLAKFLDTPVVSSSHGNPVTVPSIDRGSEFRSIFRMPWSPKRVVLEVVFTIAVVLACVWWYKPEWIEWARGLL